MSEYTKTILLVLAGVYGLCIGSFLNVVVYRLPAGIKMTNDRSHCPDCGAMIRWYDNIPLLSYLLLLGKCRNCGKRISPRYPIVEASNMIGWLLCFRIFQEEPIYAGVCAVAFSCLICVFIIDLEHLIIYDRFQIILLVCGIASIFFDPAAAWHSHLIGAVSGVLILYGIGRAVSRRVGAEAVGMGDVKLIGVMGLFLGWEKLILAMLIGSLSATLLILIVKKKKGYDRMHEYPFGPFLAVGFAAAMLFGNAIITEYLSLLYRI